MGSKRVGDPARLGKAHILLAKLAFEAWNSGIPFPHDLLQHGDVDENSWAEFAHNSACKGWQEIQASQTWFLSVWPGRWLYFLTNRCTGKVIGRDLSTKFMLLLRGESGHEQFSPNYGRWGSYHPTDHN